MRITPSRPRGFLYRLILLISLFTVSVISAYADDPYDDEERYTLSICAIFQNEAPWLVEWIEFHRAVGVEHFFLFNHFSEDNYLELLEPYIASGVVDLVDWREPMAGIRGQIAPQVKAYKHCLQCFGRESKWIAFIDLDEFLFPVYESDLRTLLADYEEYGGLAVNWQCFGTSGVNDLQEGELLIEKLTHCMTPDNPENRWIKSIVQTDFVESGHVHHFRYREERFAVDSDKEHVPEDINLRFPIDRIRINHYWTRTEKWAYGEKLTRLRMPWRNATGEITGYQLTAQLVTRRLKRFDYQCSCQDTTIHRFVPEVKEAMGF